MNHLIVGLGGTGGKVIAAFRRAIFEQFPQVEPPELALDYLYIDSSREDFNAADVTVPISEQDSRWRMLGESVQLAPGQLVFLEQGDFAQVIGSSEDFKSYRRWIGDVDVWRTVWSNNPNGIKAGGQIRRFGRYLFAHNAAKIRTRLQDRFAAQRRDGLADANWTVHVIAGLAGGTGSGSVIDLCGMIRNIRSAADTKIIQYLVLPETEQTSWADENYYANGYAALSEINGVLVRKFRPCNVMSDHERYFGDQGAMPFDNTFLITNRNESGLVADVDTVVPQIIAETMYQLIVSSGDARRMGTPGAAQAGSSKDRAWRGMVTGENYQKGAERDDPEGDPIRANRFISFGIKRIVIPRQEIKEYASLSFLRQAMLQLLNNRWADGIGFDERPEAFDAASHVRSDAVRSRWALTDAKLLLEEKTLDNDGLDWGSLHKEFLDPLRIKAEAIIRDVKNNELWVAPLESFANERYAKQFRKVGVPEFYRVQQERVAQLRARHIASLIADDLFLQWRNGDRSARSVQTILQEELEDIRERLANFGARIVENKRTEDAKEAERKWSQGDYSSFGGKLTGRIFYSRKLALQRHAGILAELYAARARQAGYSAAQRVLSLLLPEVEALLENVKIVSSRIEKAIETSEIQQAARVPVEEENKNKGHLYKLYEGDHVRSVIKRLEGDKVLQTEQAAELRGALCQELGPQPSFAAFSQNLTEWMLIERLEKKAGEIAEEALARLEVPRDRVLEGSIIQKLYEDFGGRDADLQAFLGEQARAAGSFAKFNTNEDDRSRRDSEDRVGVERVLVVFLPSADDLSDQLRMFRERLVRLVANANSVGKTEIIDVGGRANEITFLSLSNQFAIRHLDAIKHLHDRYERLADGPRQVLKRLELHIEGDGGEIPPLLIEDMEKVRAACYPAWLLGQMMDLLQERQNPTTGRPEVIVNTTDDDGVLSVTVVGTRIDEGTASISRNDARRLNDLVDKQLARRVHVDERRALHEKLIAFQNDALVAAKMDEGNPHFAKVKAAVSRARTRIG